LLHKKELMQNHTVSISLQIGCWATFIFSLVMAYAGIVGLLDFF
jgi:hypothetical protein